MITGFEGEGKSGLETTMVLRGRLIKWPGNSHGFQGEVKNGLETSMVLRVS